jgi:uncharacterized membrane protein YbhN (UPF0104 family)
MAKALVLQRIRAAVTWLAVIAFLVAAFFVWRTIERYGMTAIVEALRAIDPLAIALACACSAASYVMLTLSDWLAMRTMVARRISYPYVALAAFTAISVGHMVGFGTVSSATIRYRMYLRSGLLEGDIVRIVVFSGVTVTLGLVALAGSTSLLQPGPVAEFARMPTGVLTALASAALLAVVLYVIWAARSRRELRLFRFRIPVPSVATACAQVAIGMLNYVFVSATLHALLGAGSGISLLTFAAYYTLGHVLAILTHVPAGLGVIELVVLSVAPGPASVGGLIAFRVVYYLAPFVVGALLYGAFEWKQRRARSSPDAAEEADRARHATDRSTLDAAAADRPAR